MNSERPASSRDPDPWRNASSASAHAFGLYNEALRAWARPLNTRLWKEAAEAFEVAADAWEEAGDDEKANIHRAYARTSYVESFVTSHRRLTYGNLGILGATYMISDAEACRLAAQVHARPPAHGQMLLVPLTHVGPRVELHRLPLNANELRDLKRKRPWTYAVAGAWLR